MTALSTLTRGALALSRERLVAQLPSRSDLCQLYKETSTPSGAVLFNSGIASAGFARTDCSDSRIPQRKSTGSVSRPVLSVISDVQSMPTMPDLSSATWALAFPLRHLHHHHRLSACRDVDKLVVPCESKRLSKGLVACVVDRTQHGRSERGSEEDIQ